MKTADLTRCCCPAALETLLQWALFNPTKTVSAAVHAAKMVAAGTVGVGSAALLLSVDALLEPFG